MAKTTSKKQIKPTSKQIVESTVAYQESVKAASKQDYANVPSKEYEPTAHLTKKEKKNVIHLKPLRRIKVKTTKPLSDEERRFRDYMWEEVEGIFENRAIIGENMVFWDNPFPEDDYAEWSVPCNVVVAAPRWLAKHLNERSYITFKEKVKDPSDMAPNGFVSEIVPDQIIHRTTFMRVGEY